MNIRGQIAKINEEYQQATRNNPFDVINYYNLGIKYTKQNKLRAAEICYRKALWLSPHDPELLNNLGCIYLKNKKYQMAKIIFTRALRFNPQLAAAVINLKKVNQLML